MRKILVIVLFAISFFSCKDQVKSKKILVTDNIVNSLLLSEISEAIDVKIINNVNGIMSSNIVSIHNYKDQLLLHSNTPSLVSLIDSSGEVVRSHKAGGIGPYSIKGLNEIDVFKDEIYALDRENFKIHRLDSDLKIIETIKIDFYCQSFKKISDHKFILYLGKELSTNNKGSFVVFDSKNKTVIRDLLPIDKNTMNFFKFMTNNHILSSKNGDHILWDSTHDQIYKYDDGELKTRYVIDYGDYGLEENFYSTAQFDNSYDFLKNMRKTDYAFRHFNFKSNDNYFCFTYEKGGEFINTLYNKNTGETINFKKVYEDLFTGLDLPGFNFFIDLLGHDSFVILLPFEYLANVKKTELTDKLEIAKLNQKDVLIFGKLKF